jgi:type IV pilus assembly protein PilO
MNLDINEIKENKSYQIIAGIIGGGLVFAIAFYFILIAPKAAKISELKAKIAEKQTFLAKAGSIEKQKQKIVDAKVKIKELEQDISYYEKKLPQEKDIPDLLQYLSNIGTETNIKLLEIEKKQEIRQEQEQAFYVTVPFNLILKGGYHEIGKFINRLENAERFMKIENLKIEEDKRNPFEHRGEMVVYTYILDTREESDDE